MAVAHMDWSGSSLIQADFGPCHVRNVEEIVIGETYLLVNLSFSSLIIRPTLVSDATGDFEVCYEVLDRHQKVLRYDRSYLSDLGVVRYNSPEASWHGTWNITSFLLRLKLEKE